MADQEKDKEMDEMLDSLLANYSSAEPRPGLETRILANLREAEKKASQGWWSFKWIWAGMVAAAIVMAVVLINGRHRIEPPTNVVAKTPARNSASRAGCSTGNGQSPSAQTIDGSNSPAECGVGVESAAGEFPYTRPFVRTGKTDVHLSGKHTARNSYCADPAQ